MAGQAFGRIQWQGKAHFVLSEGDAYRLITAAPYEAWQPTPTRIAAGEAELLAPVAPSKIIAVGLNYRSHALEMNMPLPSEPLLFLKPPTALAHPGQTVRWPPSAGRVDFEGELALVIGRTAQNLTPEKAMDHVLGFTLANDITARDLQMRDGQWARAKGFDGFCPLGPWVATALDWESFEFQTRVQGRLRQTGNLGDLIFALPEIVAFASQVMTLLPGDVILTGTPPGVGPLAAGDRVEIASRQIGTLTNFFAR
jgi:2-keto-4-pentenoate hydratase/2-oxohepta-3-ene-1,7-dioic acid hydratase in catechol pathway